MYTYLFYLVLNYVYECVCVWVCADVYSAWGSQKGASDPLKLESQVVVRGPTWVPGTEVSSSARIACPPNR